ncbi:MAG TPA: isoprenylcysteine carboxylmethyltransferase family protein [Verrucomicrobiae bacterium]|nr:isoprenylcysteine carboxylmethyltransferase family protein [Verrucomicrobiae bacterium]
MRRLMRVPVPWVFIMAYLLGVVLETLFPSHPSTPAPAAVVVAGAVVFTTGALIAGWGLFLFRRSRTTTIPGRLSSSLVTWGPYRFSRNPMYVGLALAYLGEAGLLKQIWPLPLLLLIVAYLNWVVIPVEEGRLLEAFGPEYQQYQARVRRWL